MRWSFLSLYCNTWVSRYVRVGQKRRKPPRQDDSSKRIFKKMLVLVKASKGGIEQLTAR